MVPLLKGKDGGTLQLADLSSDQLLLSLGLRSIMRERGLDPQEDAALKQALPAFLRHASVVRVGKAQVGEARDADWSSSKSPES
ncbi:unnamed protein product [Ectocarpus sp. 12 AP-2014]